MGVADLAPMLVGALLLLVASRELMSPVASRNGSSGLVGPVRKPRDEALNLVLLRERSAERVDPAFLTASDLVYYAVARRDALGVGKRLLDVLAAAALIVIFAPVLALTALAIRIEGPGPILYRQKRVGLGGKEFEILKFRSMVLDAEKNGAQWAERNDTRVTRVGRFIRATRVDEIPQAFNVLRGEMSFVGPRPERPEFVAVLEKEIPNYHLRHVVRPGITGWAQVKYVYGASVEDSRIKLEYDLHYIKNFTLWLDLVIMLLTVRVTLFGIGSR